MCNSLSATEVKFVSVILSFELLHSSGYSPIVSFCPLPRVAMTSFIVLVKDRGRAVFE